MNYAVEKRRAAPAKAARGVRRPQRVLDARPDTVDFRDKMFEPTLIEVPPHIPLEIYRSLNVPVLDQGSEGACTGFGLATVANYLLSRRKVQPDPTPVSARMFYEMARRYDEWPGENYSGSSARGAMKGWHKHGVCSEEQWKYKAPGTQPGGLTMARTTDALRRPLGAYLRVNHQDLVAMHSALAEVGILYATGVVHEGWEQIQADGSIPFSSQQTGGHAFAIVAYDAKGFWIQNSWGTDWGQEGFARISYDDWLTNGTDVWVARLGAPIELHRSESAALAHTVTAGRSVSYSFMDLRPHIVSLGNDGELQPGGDYGTTARDVQHMFEEDLPRAMEEWPVKHVLLYAHGGLVDERSAIQRLAEYRSAMMDVHVYPISFIWHSDYWNTITNVLQDAMRQRRPEGVLDAAKNLLLDRLDDTLEIIARKLTGKLAWDQMKQNALAATAPSGGARIALEHLARLRKTMDFKLHVVGHSAGSIFHAPLVRLLTAPAKRITSGYLKGETGYGQAIDSLTLWAPACTVDLFKQSYLPAFNEGSIERLALFALTDEAEQDDNCANIYRKSLLYLVSRSFEESAFGDGTPLLGMQRWLERDLDLVDLFKTNRRASLVYSPNTYGEGTAEGARARAHNAFDDDPYTTKATLRRILESAGATGVRAKSPEFSFRPGGSALRKQREQIDRQAPMRV